MDAQVGRTMHWEGSGAVEHRNLDEEGSRIAEVRDNDDRRSRKFAKVRASACQVDSLGCVHLLDSVEESSDLSLQRARPAQQEEEEEEEEEEDYDGGKGGSDLHAMMMMMMMMAYTRVPRSE